MLVLWISKLEKKRGGIGWGSNPSCSNLQSVGSQTKTNKKKTRTDGAPPFRRHLFAFDIYIVIVITIVVVIVLVTLFPLSSSLI